MTILEEIGIDFRDDAGARAEREAGADVNGERVRIPRELYGTSSARRRDTPSTPATPSATSSIGGRNTVFAPTYGSPFVRDFDEQAALRHASRTCRNFVKLAYMTPALHHSGGVICEPVDVPVPKRHLDIVYSPHPLFRQALHGHRSPQPDRAEDTVRLARSCSATSSSTGTR